MPGRDEVFGAADGAGDEARRVGAIRGADAGGDAVARLDAHGEGGAERGPAAAGGLHHRELEPLDLLLGEREADEAAAVRGHEVDGLGGDDLGGHAEVALVLAVLVVDEDDHLAGADVVDGAVDALEQLGVDGDGGHEVVFYMYPFLRSNSSSDVVAAFVPRWVAAVWHEAQNIAREEVDFEVHRSLAASDVAEGGLFLRARDDRRRENVSPSRPR